MRCRSCGLETPEEAQLCPRCGAATEKVRTGLRLRSWPPPDLPERPYPVLLPYTHPELLAGRERELSELRRRLRLPVAILGLSAPSGTGKSSLLLGGLVPVLRRRGRPVALVRHAHEPGLATRLLGDLGEEETATAVRDPASFVELLLGVERLAGGEAPILVLDQFEDVLRRDDAVAARADLGWLLAATARRLPGRHRPPCRWLLAYRQEYHGDVVAWLGDVLRDARAEGLPVPRELPHDLSTSDRFHWTSLGPLGTPLRGADAALEATWLFQAAIEAPLKLVGGDGKPRYPWRFAGDGASRLARAFGEARVARPDAPLVPELQVVLAHLMAQAEDAAIEVPEEPGELIGQALEEHLRRALEAAFPPGRAEARTGRARALLALRELADATGETGEGLGVDVLSRAIGRDGEEILERLSTPLTRLVVVQERPEGLRYVLSHDRMAEVVVRTVEREGRRGGLVVDSELLALRRFVTLQSALFHAREEEQATRLPRRRYRRIAANAEALLWDAERREWWTACRARRRRDLTRRAGWAVAASLTLSLLGVAAWSGARSQAEHRARLEQVAQGEPRPALVALEGMMGDAATDPEELLAALRRRRVPMDLLSDGLGAVAEKDRGATVLRAAELVLPLVDKTPEDPVLIANLVWALDYAPCREAAHAGRARSLRERILGPLRRIRPPPPPPAPGDPDWASIPGGTFDMGSGDDERLEEESYRKEHPQHRVTVSPFRLLRHEVTAEELRRLFPDYKEFLKADGVPARGMTWYESYLYAAWLGGRLPTEAEWEYAARAGCRYAYCDRDGREASVDQVAWTTRNAVDPGTLEPVVHPVMRLMPNPWGLYDMLGNVWEVTADFYGPYVAAPQVDPVGPPGSDARVCRGGAVLLGENWAHPAGRAAGRAGPEKLGGFDIGFRVAYPACR